MTIDDNDALVLKFMNSTNAQIRGLLTHEAALHLTVPYKSYNYLFPT